MRAEEVIQEVAKLCNSFHAKEVILYGSRAKGTARERSDIDIAVSGIEDFERKSRRSANTLQCGSCEYGYM